MIVSKIEKVHLTNEVVDHLLYEGLDYNGESGECALVLGSAKAPIYRIPLAVMLYESSKVRKILLCGGTMRETQDGVMTEAQIMKERASALGVPECDILTEEPSRNTKENMLCALLPLDRAFGLINLRKIILITTTFHMRRGLRTAQVYLPNWINVVPCPADDMNTRRENWWRTEAGRKRATDESWKIICAIREGAMPDFTI